MIFNKSDRIINRDASGRNIISASVLERVNRKHPHTSDTFNLHAHEAWHLSETGIVTIWSSVAVLNLLLSCIKGYKSNSPELPFFVLLCCFASISNSFILFSAAEATKASFNSSNYLINNRKTWKCLIGSFIQAPVMYVILIVMDEIDNSATSDLPPMMALAFSIPLVCFILWSLANKLDYRDLGLINTPYASLLFIIMCLFQVTMPMFSLNIFE